MDRPPPIDVATNIDGQQVMTFTPGADFVCHGEASLDRLALARDLEILTASPAIGPTPQRAMNACDHGQTTEIPPIPLFRSSNARSPSAWPAAAC